jgi:hypothetical protein
MVQALPPSLLPVPVPKLVLKQHLLPLGDGFGSPNQRGGRREESVLRHEICAVSEIRFGIGNSKLNFTNPIPCCLLRYRRRTHKLDCTFSARFLAFSASWSGAFHR